VTPSFSASRLPVALESSKKMLWAGRVLSGLAVAFLLIGAVMKVSGAAAAEKGTAEVGWGPKRVFGLGVLQRVLLAIHLFPRTAVFGALLWVGCLGGAVATHARISHPPFSHTLFPV
jgi:hypothetical protein